MSNVRHEVYTKELSPFANYIKIIFTVQLHLHVLGNQCKNGGIMTMGENDVFKCLCPPKYGGPLCEGKPLLFYKVTLL